MPADGMLLTVAEAADSSLLGARQPQLCSTVCLQVALVVDLLRHRQLEWSCQHALSHLPPCSRAWAVGRPCRHRQPGAPAELPDPHPRTVACRRSSAAGASGWGTLCSWRANAALPHVGKAYRHLPAVVCKAASHLCCYYCCNLPCAGGAPVVPHSLPTCAFQPVPLPHTSGSLRQCHHNRLL